MYSNYYEKIELDRQYDDFVEAKMNEQRKESLKSICKLVRQDIAEDFAHILSVARDDGSIHADNIASLLGFDQSDFLALSENFEDYKKYYEQNADWSRFYE